MYKSRNLDPKEINHVLEYTFFILGISENAQEQKYNVVYSRITKFKPVEIQNL